jgi:hypothetical protein
MKSARSSVPPLLPVREQLIRNNGGQEMPGRGLTASSQAVDISRS